MADYESLLNRWQSADVLDAEAARRIRDYEQKQQKPAGLRWQGVVALILGGILLACGVVLFVSAHWDQMGPGSRFALVMGMVTVFHLGGGLARANYRGLSTALHGVGTVSTGAAIALVGQIFNIQEHWPAAILMWAVAALAGWILLQDEAQQILTFLLFPAWMFSEMVFYASGHIGERAYTGRFLFVWAILYLTLFLSTKRRVNQGVLFAVGAVAAVVGVAGMLESWTSWYYQSSMPLKLRIWDWILIAALPLLLAIFRPLKSLVPVAAALALSLALPWCVHTWTEYYNFGEKHQVQVRTEPNLWAHGLVAVFAVFLIWWGVRLAEKLLVNYGVVAFAIAVGWFYFSDIFDKVGRSLGLIGLGVLFLAGGWALEKARRKLMAQMDKNDLAPQEAA